MLRRVALLVALGCCPASARDVPVLAEFHTESGSLPPEDARRTDVTILADGRLTLTRCKGYATEGSACKTRKATVAPQALTAIIEAAVASGLDRSPARKSEVVIIGGSVTAGAVCLDGRKIALIPEPAKADAPRVSPRCWHQSVPQSRHASSGSCETEPCAFRLALPARSG